MQLRDLKRSILDLSQENAMHLIVTRRAARRNPMNTQAAKTRVKKKTEKLAANASQQDIQEVLERLGGLSE